MRFVTKELIVLALGVGVRVPFITLSPVHSDAEFYFSRASDILRGHIQFSPHLGIESVMSVFILVFNGSGANIASFFASVLTIIAMIYTGTVLFNSKDAGIAVGAVLAVTPLHIYFSWWAITEPIALLVLSIGLLFISMRKWGLSAVMIFLLLFMRAEYNTILLSYLILKIRPNSLSKFPVLAIPTMVFASITILLSNQLINGVRLVDFISGKGFSIGSITQFINTPFYHITRNIQFYLYHFLHWGVPYFEIILINPLLPIAFIIGVSQLTSRLRVVRISNLLVTVGIVIGFIYRELTLGKDLIGMETPYLLTIYSLFGIFLLYLGMLVDNERLFPLLSIVPYLYILGVLYINPRYLLPVVIVFSLYAGYGVYVLTESINMTDSGKLSVPRIL